MNMMKKMLKPTSTFLVILLVLIPSFYQSASAAMIGTEMVLQPDRNQKTRDYLHDLLSREKIRQVLVARGVNPQEAKDRIDCLSDDEIEQIFEKFDDLPAGAGVGGFVVVVGAVILALILIVELTSEVKMFPQLQSSD